jgi:polyferredoxin
MGRITEILSAKRRFVFLFIGMLLFLPPLSFVPQAAGEPNMCGKVCPRLFIILSPKGILPGALSNIQAMWFGVMLVAVILAVTYFFGRLWCSHLCPIGGFSEMVSRIFPGWMKINFTGIDVPAFRYGYFAVFVVGAYAGIGAIACKLCNFRVIPFLVGAPFEPAYVAYFSTSMGLAGLLSVSVFGFFARGGRAYCNLLCPVGAMDAAVNYIACRFGSTRKVRTDRERCDGCGSCVRSCMVGALSVDGTLKIRRDALVCMSCRDCEKVCPQGAIAYGKGEKR